MRNKDFYRLYKNEIYLGDYTKEQIGQILQCKISLINSSLLNGNKIKGQYIVKSKNDKKTRKKCNLSAEMQKLLNEWDEITAPYHSTIERRASGK